MAEVKIDVGALNQAISKSLQERAGSDRAAKTPSPAKLAAIEAFPSVKQGFASLGSIDTVQATFCDLWPKAYAGIKFALQFAKWFLPPSSVNAIRAVVDGINTQLYPVICANK